MWKDVTISGRFQVPYKRTSSIIKASDSCDRDPSQLGGPCDAKSTHRVLYRSVKVGENDAVFRVQSPRAQMAEREKGRKREWEVRCQPRSESRYQGGVRISKSLLHTGGGRKSEQAPTLAEGSQLPSLPAEVARSFDSC